MTGRKRSAAASAPDAGDAAAHSAAAHSPAAHSPAAHSPAANTDVANANVAKHSSSPPIDDRAFVPQRVISGGQTGVDRGALDAAIALGIPHGGACPRGRLAEDGAIPAKYALTELESSDYRDRTERNVLDAHATLILCRGAVRGGTALTRRLARDHRRPYLVAGFDDDALAKVRGWLTQVAPVVLNVAGPRESHAPGIAEQTRAFLVRVLS